MNGCGSVTFTESNRVFADNDLTEGSELFMTCGWREREYERPLIDGRIRIVEWRDWNSFDFEIIDPLEVLDADDL